MTFSLNLLSLHFTALFLAVSPTLPRIFPFQLQLFTIADIWRLLSLALPILSSFLYYRFLQRPDNGALRCL